MAKFYALSHRQQRCVRVGIAIGFPFALVWGYVERFCREFKNACWHTRQEGRIVIEDFRRFWRETKQPKEPNR